MNRFSFLPYAISQVLDRAETPDAGGRRLSLNYDLSVTVNGTETGNPVEIGADIRGPGDILGIDPKMITRTEPTRGLRGFEPNYFPLIEFEDVDYPWRYSLDIQGARRRTPWLTLIALEASEFSFVETERGPLQVINVDNGSDSLPPLDQAWAYAHVHLSDVGETDHEIDEALERDTTQSFARLMCPRKLEPLKSYYCFLVPTYEAGRLAGLGQPQDGLDAANYDQFSWDDSSDAAVTLPIYYQWRFTTDVMEDVELLLRRLRALEQDLLRGLVQPDRISAAIPGYYPDYAKPGASFERETAMQLPQTGMPEFDTDPALADLMIETLEEVIDGETQAFDDEEDPLVAFQPYGFRYQGETTVSRPKAVNHDWFDQINLDLKFRQVASLGAEIVRKNQETFSFIAWSQYDEIVEANQQLMRLQTSAILADRLVQKHFVTLDSTVALTLAAPLTDITQVAKGRTVSTALTENGVPLSYSDRTLRNQASKRSQATKATTGSVAAQSVPVPSYVTELATSEPAQKKIKQSRSTLKKSSVRAGERVLNIEGLKTDNLLIKKGLADEIKGEFSVLFNVEDVVDLPRLSAPVLATRVYDPNQLVSPISTTLTRLPKAKAQFSIAGLLEKEKKDLKPVWRAPTIPMPTSALLTKLDPDALLTGIDNLPDNTVSILEENRPFVEALLVGMNHEMNNELRWREFPTDMRGTIFKRFWNRGRDTGAATLDDIGPIHEWNRRFGKNAPAEAENAAENIIVMIKGDIVRKLNDPIIAINIAEQEGEFVATKGQDITPAFAGKVRSDIAYYGFEISLEELLDPAIFEKAFFVIYEAPGKLRFGLDVGRARVRHASLNVFKQAYGFGIGDAQVLHNRRRTLQTNPIQFADTATPATPVTPSNPSDPPMWDDFSWNDVSLHGSGYINFGRTMPERDGMDLWSSERSSASLARSFWQKPVAAALPLSRVIEDG